MDAVERKGHDAEEEQQQQQQKRMIEQLITTHQVPVVASLQWEALQSLLLSLSSRLAHQASRIEKAEDQGKALSAIADDLERSCKNRMKEVQEGKGSEEAKLQSWSKMIEERLKGLDDTLSQQSSKEIGLQGVDVSHFQSLPLRVAALEEKIGGKAPKTKVEGGVSESGVVMDHISEQLDTGIEGLPEKSLDHNKRLDSLEEQIKDLKALVQGISKAHSSDFESIQNICRNLRADLEMKPILDMPHLETSHGKLEDVSKTGVAIEVTKEGGTKRIGADILDTHVRQLEGEIASLATQLASKADRRDLDGLRIQMTLIDHVIGNDEEHMDVLFSPEQHIQVQLGQTQDQEDQTHDQRTEGGISQQSPAIEKMQTNTLRNGLDIQRKRPTLDSVGSMLQKFQDLISQKADRSELLQLHEMLNHQRSDIPSTPANSSTIEGLQKSYNGLVQELNGITKTLKEIEERSDLAVLLSKRLDNFAQPAATIQDSSEGLEDIQAAINEHAERMMSYADSLLQIQTLLASKADAAGLQALKASIVDLNKRKPTSGSFSSLRASRIQSRKTVSDIFVEDKVERNDKLFSQLVNVVDLLGKSVLTMSGAEFQQRSHDELVNGLDMDKVDADIAYVPDDMKVHQSADFTRPVKLSQKQTFSIERLEPLLEDELHLKDDVEENILHEIHGQGSEISVHDTEANGPSKLENKNCNCVLKHLEETLQAVNNIKPKADENVVTKLNQEISAISLKSNEMEKALSLMQEKKAEKAELQKMKNYIKQKLERAENAMLSGKALLGFKCMSCDHPLDKLGSNRAEFVPTNCMRPQVLPMHSAERLYSHRDAELPDGLSSPSGASIPLVDNENKSIINELQTSVIQSDLIRSPSPVKLKQIKKS